ncbi:MAG: DNA repair protein RadC [Actinomycetota bacterium]|nr:DNA repair protein RadC [Actinomycetota bacterium]
MAAVPLEERPRERLAAHGVESLSARELLALVLRNGTRGRSALDVADELLAGFGSLAGLAAALPEELAGSAGVGHAKAAALVAAFRLARKVEAPVVRELLRTAEDAARVASRELAGLRRERVLVLACDTRNALRHVTCVSDGSVDRSLVPVREILNAVLRHDGRAFALAHNHPDGDPEPSEADRRATANVKAAAEVAGLRFLGHVVVAGADWRALI